MIRLAGIAVLFVAAAQAQESRPRHAPEPFERILYLQGPGLRDQAAAERVRGLGFTSVMTGSAAQAARAAAAGLGVVLDQVAGKGILELRDAEWLTVQRAYDDGRDPRTLERPSVLAEPATLQRLLASADVKLAEFSAVRPWAVSLGDEISVTRHRNPLDLCFAPASLESFRAGLLARYGSVDALNLAWGTTFPTASHVRPFTADEIRNREHGPGLPGNLLPWSEHRAFMDQELARVVGALAEHVRTRTGGVPCGLFGMQPPAAYGGHDLRLLLRGQGACEVYDEGGALPLARSLAAPGTRLFLTLGPTSGPDAASLALAKVASCVAAGLAGVVVWNSELVLDEAGAPSAWGTALQRAFTRLAPVLARAGPREDPGSIWILESQASVRAWWMLDSADDGKSWIRRLSSYEATHSTSLAAREGWSRILGDLGCPARFVAEEDLPRVRTGMPPPRLLVLPAQVALSDATLRTIVELAAKGTVVVADHEPALYDERLRLRPVPGLDSCFGVERVAPANARGPREGKPLATLRTPSGAAAAEPGLRSLRALCEKSAGTVVQNERLENGGIWCYLNLALCEYPNVRLDPERVDTARDLRRRVQRVLELANVIPAFPLRGAGLPTCLERAVLSGRDGERTLVVRVDALAAPAILAELARGGARSVEWFGQDDLRGQDLLGGGEEQVGKVLRFPLDVWSGLWVRLPPAK